LITAAWVARVNRPLIRDGGIVFDYGNVLAVGSAESLRASHPDAHAIDLGAAIVLPGLVNAHTHLELSDRQPGPPPESFVEWLLRLIPSAPTQNDAALAQRERATQIGICQSLRFGVTCVGDISRFTGVTRPVIRASPLCATSYGEVAAMAARRSLLESSARSALRFAHSPGHPRRGISPHAPYSVEVPGYQHCLGLARRNDLPITTHLAESPDEARFLCNQQGPFRDLWDKIGGWDDRVPAFDGGPIRMAKSVGLLDYPKASLAHVNYCDDAELDVLAAGRASVVYCPRTHAYFGHPPHRWREMLARGINVAIGTDSCASSPDLNLVDDLRLMHRIAPEFGIEELWRMATIRAARAIGRDGEIGSIEVGKSADFAAFPSAGDQPLRDILESNTLPTRIWIGGHAIP
jgi:cytosine/adenosine deaminase-related metal-dependent hydrolase